MKVDGQCHCGAIRFEAEVAPGTIGICHCTDCQTLTGSAFRAVVPAPAASFVLRGIPTEYIKTAESGTKRRHAFCPSCGTPVYATAMENPASYSLRVGTLRQRAELGAPARQIWCRSALPWTTSLDAVPRAEKQT
jgi:hypothetical protein